MNGMPMMPKAPSSRSLPEAAGGELRSERASATGVLPANALPPSAVDSSSPENFIRSIAPYAARVSKATGIPAEVLIGMAANETGFGKYAEGNNLFGIKGTGPAGSFSTQTWEDYGAGRVDIQDSFRAYHSPAESMMDFAKLVMTSPRYAGAMGQTSVTGFVDGLRRGGYMTDPNYVNKIDGITTRYSGVIRESLQSTGQGTPAASAVLAGTQPVRAVGSGVMVPDQFDVGLPPDEAYAACGPMAAIAFAQAYGRNPTPKEAMDLAKQSGWTSAGGMNGIANEKRLLDKMGIPGRLETNLDWSHVQADALNRNPVIISTPGHYYVIDGYDQRNGAYHVGQSGRAYRGGSDWMTPAQMTALSGAPHAALYTENPLPAGSTVAVAPRPAPVVTASPPATPLVAAAPARPAVPPAPAEARPVVSTVPVVKPFAAPVEKGAMQPVVPPAVPVVSAPPLPQVLPPTAQSTSTGPAAARIPAKPAAAAPAATAGPGSTSVPPTDQAASIQPPPPLDLEPPTPLGPERPRGPVTVVPGPVPGAAPRADANLPPLTRLEPGTEPERHADPPHQEPVADEQPPSDRTVIFQPNADHGAAALGGAAAIGSLTAKPQEQQPVKPRKGGKREEDE